MILVINDNHYGLMFELRYTCDGYFHLQCMKNTGWIEGWNPSTQIYALLLDNEWQFLWINNGIKLHMKACSLADERRILNGFGMNAIYI